MAINSITTQMGVAGYTSSRVVNTTATASYTFI
jgi:hypothetical protein